MDKVKRLQVLRGQDFTVGKRPTFTPSQACYSPPNVDGSRKACVNCTFWSLDMDCFIHEPGVVVMPDMVCNHHLEGAPGSSEELPRQNVTLLEPELSGLRQGPSSCDSCEFYEPHGALSGGCAALVDPGDPQQQATVAALARCAHWEPKGL